MLSPYSQISMVIWVRVVKIGDFNTEFCGGDHVKNTNELGLFKIVSEGGVGAGVRRIEAVTSSDAFKFLKIVMTS